MVMIMEIDAQNCETDDDCLFFELFCNTNTNHCEFDPTKRNIKIKPF